MDRSATVLKPLSFSAFCDRCFSEQPFRKFYEQLHMFIWFIADGKYVASTEKIGRALDDLMGFLQKQNLLAGLTIERPTINRELPPPEPQP